MGSKDFLSQIISFQGTRLKAMPLSPAPGFDVKDKDREEENYAGPCILGWYSVLPTGAPESVNNHVKW